MLYDSTCLSVKEQEEPIERVRIEEWVIFGRKGWGMTGRKHRDKLLAGNNQLLDCVHFVIIHLSLLL